MVGRGLYFDELTTGETYRSERLTVTEESIIRFAFEWDPQPFHVDRIASGDSIFGELIGSGLQTFLLSYRLYFDIGILKGTALAGLGIDELKFVRPLRPADTIEVIVTIGEKAGTRRPDRGRVKVQLETKNDRGETILTLTINALVAVSGPGVMAEDRRRPG